MKRLAHEGWIVAVVGLAGLAPGRAQDGDDGPPPIRSSLDGRWEDEEDELDLMLPYELEPDGGVVISGAAETHHLPPGRWSGEACAAALAGDDPEARRRAVLECVLLDEEQLTPLVTGLAARFQDASEEADIRQVATQVLGRLGRRAGAAAQALLSAVDDELLGLEATLALNRVVTIEAVPTLAAGLQSASPAVRSAATAALARLVRSHPDPAACQALVAPLGAVVDDDGEDGHVRRLAAWSLGRLGAQARPALSRLVSALRDENVAGEAMVALVRLDTPETVPALLAVLAEPASEPVARRHCAQLLALLGRRLPAAQDALLRALGDPAPDVRVEVLRAAQALGLWERVVPRLAALLEDPDEEVVFVAATLACENQAAWPPAALDALERAYRRFPVESVRRVLLDALSRFGAAQAARTMPLFRDALEEDEGAADEALRGLTGLGAQAAPALEEVLAHLDGRLYDPASPAWETLAAIGSAAAPGAAPLLAHGDRRVRARAAEVLAASGPAARAVLPAVEQALPGELYPEVRGALELAGRSLRGELPPTAAQEALRALLRGPASPPEPLSPLGVGPARASQRPRPEGPRCFELRLDARGPLSEDLVRDWDALLAEARLASRLPDLQRQRVALERAWVNHLAPALRTRADLCQRVLRRLLDAPPERLRAVLGEAPLPGDLVLAAGPDEQGDERQTVLVMGERAGRDGAPAPRLIAPESQQQQGEVWLPSYLSWPEVIPRLDLYEDHVGWIAVGTEWALAHVAPDGWLALDPLQSLRLRLTSEDLARLRQGDARLYVRAGGWGPWCLRTAAEVDRSGPLPSGR